MYGLKLTDGDIAVRGDGDVTRVTGEERLTQELSCWLLEPLGFDQLYPGFGSTLGQHIGQPLTSDQMNAVSAETARVVGNYVAYQQVLMENSPLTASQFLDVWTDSDVIQSVRSIGVSSVTDTCSVKITLRTGNDQLVTVTQTA
jgi:phage baseplate assembly protein W